MLVRFHLLPMLRGGSASAEGEECVDFVARIRNKSCRYAVRRPQRQSLKIRCGKSVVNRPYVNNLPLPCGRLLRICHSAVVLPRTASGLIFKNRGISTFLMGDYPLRGRIPINSRGLRGSIAMDCGIRDFSRENSRGFRNPLTSPGKKQPACRFRLGLPSVPKQGKSPGADDTTVKR